ncbi:hypothetical protein [Paraglaciecola aestuariivivens]
MPNYRILFIVLFALGFNSSCANSDHFDPQAKNQFVTEFYAWVEGVEKVKFQSYAGQAAAIGAVDGLLHNLDGNREDMLAGLLVGGLFGGLVTALFEGDNTGYEYQLAAIDGDRVNVIASHKPASVGQCVSVIVAGKVKISPLPEALCESEEQQFMAQEL